MRGRKPIVVGAVLVVVALVAVGAWYLLRDHSNPFSPMPTAQARPSAEAACGLMKQFEGQVKSNTPASVALKTLDEAATNSNHAYRGDVIWVRLDSGVNAVRAGFRKNDAQATRIGIAVVRDECTEFALPSPTASSTPTTPSTTTPTR